MTTYPKQLHTFPKDEFKNPDGPTTAWVYNGIMDPLEPYANYIIEEIEDPRSYTKVGGKFMLVLENDSFISDKLSDLEPRLFAWMENEGVTSKELDPTEVCLVSCDDLASGIHSVMLGSVEYVVVHAAVEALVANWNDHNPEHPINEDVMFTKLAQVRPNLGIE
jgi:hypothetical protein